jgi:outer membrane receptor protein involved in Fe transport
MSRVLKRRAWPAGLLLIASTASCELALGAVPEASTLEEVVVSASRLRDEAQLDVPASITVLSSKSLVDSAQQHFQEVLTQVPNLNWAAGSSRPRYFQIRGIGEREQYEGAPNASVGFLIDDIDFSGIGMAATLFDVSQVEVLHGPQGTRLGANALAGLIAVQSADPETDFGARATVDLGNYDTGSVGISATGPVDAIDSSWRLAVQKYRTDGFRRNAYLDREDTNGRDELTVRGKWRWQPSESNQLDFTFMHVDLDNRYDAFSIDNSRVTLSDAPGHDAQRVSAGAVKWDREFASGFGLKAIATALSSSSVHAYDGDWGNPQSWAPYDYDFIYRADRDRDNQTLEVRVDSSVGSTEWLVGLYVSRLTERIGEASFSNSFGVNEFLQSRFAADTAAVFAQLDGSLTSRFKWSAGLRGERREAEYRDAGDWGGLSNRVTHDQAGDTLLGGQATLTYELAQRTRLHAAVSRGYKAGGINLGLARQRQTKFDPEFLWNYELGWKTAGDEWYADVTLFYMQRKHMQVRSGTQLVVGDPNSYSFVTQNVASGYNYGLESSVQWAISSIVSIGASLGLLKTQQQGALREDGGSVPPREQSHAPNYQAQVNATLRHPSGLMARVDVAAVDSFYFDVPTDHDQQSDAHVLTNLKLGFEAQRWSVHAWLRNAFDEGYATRGFYFGNEPPNYEDKLYTQSGEPRTYGMSMEWRM